MLAPLVEIAQLAFACAGFTALVVLISRSAIAGAIMVLAAFVLFEATSPPLIDGLAFQLGGFSLYPLDITSLALLVVGLARLFSDEVSGLAKLALLTIVLLLVAHVLWGASDFGTQQAINYGRLWLLIVSGLVYGATVKNWDRRLPTLFITTGCFLALFSIFQILRRGLHQAETTIQIGGQFVDARPVIGMGVLVMLEGLVLLFARGRFTPARSSMAVLLATGIVLVQFRTLWVAAIAAAALGAFYLAVRYRPSNERIVYSLTGLGLLLVPLLLFMVSQVGTYQESVRSSTGQASTLTWRIGAWETLLAEHSSPLGLLFGTPSGTDRQIVVQGIATDRSAHNIYVEALLLFGLIGFFALTAVGALALRHRAGSARQLEIAAPAVVILIVCNAIVILTTQPDQVQGLLLGALLSAACFQAQPSPATVRATVGRQELALSR